MHSNIARKARLMILAPIIMFYRKQVPMLGGMVCEK
jgi:hypothetical protein